MAVKTAEEIKADREAAEAIGEQNLKLWRSFPPTDPSHQKKIEGKDYGGNSIKPHWVFYQLTEKFGPIGIGWGFDVIEDRMEVFGETHLHTVKAKLWYILNGQRGEVVQYGHTKAAYTTKNGFKVDEDYAKKSLTDAVTKCASYLGVASDIWMGYWGDSKYVAKVSDYYGKKSKRTGEPDMPDDAAKAPDSSTMMAGYDVSVQPTTEQLASIALEIDQSKSDGELKVRGAVVAAWMKGGKVSNGAAKDLMRNVVQRRSSLVSDADYKRFEEQVSYCKKKEFLTQAEVDTLLGQTKARLGKA